MKISVSPPSPKSESGKNHLTRAHPKKTTFTKFLFFFSGLTKVALPAFFLTSRSERVSRQANNSVAMIAVARPMSDVSECEAYL